jgi:hypothetical protein
MTIAKLDEPFALSALNTLSEVLKNRLPEVWGNKEPPSLFENGINSVSVSVKVGLVEVAVSVAGPGPK